MPYNGKPGNFPKRRKASAPCCFIIHTATKRVIDKVAACITAAGPKQVYEAQEISGVAAGFMPFA